MSFIVNTRPDDQAPLGGQTILVADDDPILSETLRKALEAFGAERVLLAADGHLAHRMLAENLDAVNLVVLDLRMPNEDGVGFLRHAANLNYTGRIIVISGERPEVLKGAERLAHLYGLTCIGAYRKPFHPALMLEALMTEAGHPAQAHASLAGNNEIVLREVHYQPRIDLRNEICVSAEALSRFSNAFGHPLNTEHAIEAAETNGTIEALTWNMVDHVLADARLLKDSLGAAFPLSFNVSALVASQMGFADSLREKIKGSALDTSAFTVELTETQLSDNPAVTLENLTRLRIADFGLALDDFGTGHANIEQLSAYPFTELKIDKRFTLRAEQDRFAATCVEAAVNIGKSLGLKLVAEGVENDWTHDHIRKLGVDEGQGYFYSKAITEAELVDFVTWTRKAG